MGGFGEGGEIVGFAVGDEAGFGAGEFVEETVELGFETASGFVGEVAEQGEIECFRAAGEIRAELDG